MAGKGKTKRISVTLPGELVSEIRALVPGRGISSFISDAVERHLALRRQKVALEKGLGAWKDENHPDLMTPEDSTAYVRSIREAGR